MSLRYSKQTYYLLLLFQLITINHSTTCDCTYWICDDHQYPSDEYEYCARKNPLWTDSQQCTYCPYCPSNITICSCNSQYNCNGNELNTSRTATIDASPLFWWIAALSSGGLLLCFFLCSIMIYITKSLKDDEETDLATAMQQKKREFHKEEEKKQDEEFEIYLSDHEEHSTTDINTDSSFNDDEKRSKLPLKIVIEGPKPIIPHYNTIFEHKKWGKIDIYTKYLVVGLTRNIKQLSIDTEHMNTAIYYIIKYLYNNGVSFDTYTKNKDFVMSSNAFFYGKHEWTIQVMKDCIKTQEIGIVSKLHKNLKLGSRRLSGEDLSLCCIREFGARTIYGRDSSTFYYGSYNDNNFERCKVYLNELHKYDRWIEGDRIKVVLNLMENSIAFYLNERRIGKRVKIQKNQVYHPIISHYGRFRCEVIGYK